MSQIGGVIGLSAGDAITVHSLISRELLSREITRGHEESEHRGTQLRALRDLGARIEEAVETWTGVRLKALP